MVRSKHLLSTLTPGFTKAANAAHNFARLSSGSKAIEWRKSKRQPIQDKSACRSTFSHDNGTPSATKNMRVVADTSGLTDCGSRTNPSSTYKNNPCCSHIHLCNSRTMSLPWQTNMLPICIQNSKSGKNTTPLQEQNKNSLVHLPARAPICAPPARQMTVQTKLALQGLN